MNEPLLTVSDLSAGYGKTKILNAVSLTLKRASIVCLLGPNGAGKTTLLMTLAGLLRPWSGAVRFDGVEIGRFAQHQVFGHGIALVPQSRELFPGLTVRENLELGGVRTRGKRTIDADLQKLVTRFPCLRERLERPAGELSGGEQQMLSISRAIMSRPKLLLLDEPSLALAPLIVQDIYRLIQEITSLGVSVLLVEQSAQAAMSVADHVYWMNNGRITKQGPREAFLKNDVPVARTFSGRAPVRALEPGHAE